jgi:hypothetical protein
MCQGRDSVARDCERNGIGSARIVSLLRGMEHKVCLKTEYRALTAGMCTGGKEHLIYVVYRC